MSSNEWYTPAKYINAAREVMGGIDLDPASCSLANTIVQAKRYYTHEENGLMQPWYGRVWCNPPYISEGERSTYTSWTRKLLREYEVLQTIQQAILLIAVHTERAWFQPLYAYPICFVDHQIMFIRPNDDAYHIYHGLCFVYFGPNEACFTKVFSTFGHVVRAVGNPPAKPVMQELWQESEYTS